MEITLKPSQLTEALQHCRQAKLKPWITSAPGIGKSSIVHAFAMAAGNPFHDTRLAYASPVDVRGFPIVGERNGVKVMEFAAPGDYPTLPNTVWHLDEFSAASRQTQLASLQLLLENRIGEYVAPPGTFICLSGNRSQDRAHAEKMSAAIINRICNITLVPDLDDWTTWACASGVDIRVIAFLRYRPGLLSDFDGKTWDGASGFASPRSWEFVSNLMGTEPPPAIRMALLAGLVGSGAAAEFSGFLGVYDRIPSLDGILLDPAGADVPTKPDEIYAVAAGLSTRMEPGNIDRAMIYLCRMPKEFQVFAFRLAARRNPKLLHTRAATAWTAENCHILVGC